MAESKRYDPGYRALRDEEYGSDGLPRQELYGPIEEGYSADVLGLMGLTFVMRNPRVWLVRYRGLPAYLGLKNSLGDANKALIRQLVARPVYKTPRPQTGHAALLALARREVAANFAAQQIGSANLSDFTVSEEAKKAIVRKDDVRKAVHTLRNPIARDELGARWAMLNSLVENDADISDIEDPEWRKIAKDLLSLASRKMVLGRNIDIGNFIPELQIWGLAETYASIHPWVLEWMLARQNTASLNLKFPDLRS